METNSRDIVPTEIEIKLQKYDWLKVEEKEEKAEVLTIGCTNGMITVAKGQIMDFLNLIECPLYELIP
jgi:hypothetical protein